MSQEGVDVVFEDREFNRAIDELADESRRDDIAVLTGQAIQFVRSLVDWTRLAFKRMGRVTFFRHAGRARAGWWPAWLGLGVFARPFGTTTRVLSAPEGEFIDRRHQKDEPHVVMINEVKYIEKLDREDNILTNAARERFTDMQNALDDKYTKRLRRHSAVS